MSIYNSILETSFDVIQKKIRHFSNWEPWVSRCESSKTDKNGQKDANKLCTAAYHMAFQAGNTTWLERTMRIPVL